MEAYFGGLESKLLAIPMPERKLCILASRKLLGQDYDADFLERYEAELVELSLGIDPMERDSMRALEICVEAFSLAAAARVSRLAC
ncbi:MAG: hypothetical protein KKA67_08735 [Spirochaetes bacterium]|nr:hypothetical protein [Spirochaetota bacterium]MBU1080418.1 hypothetical protein [Spirochaetota bacterium]